MSSQPKHDANSKPLIVMALPQESRGLLEAVGAQILYTGIGKVNAAATLARRLAELRCTGRSPSLVVNLGTAGSRTIAAHTLVGCHRFQQRDMDVSGLGFPIGVTPFDSAPPVIEFPPVFAHLPHQTCSSGDSFATHLHPIEAEVIDMEAFALARVCLADGMAFGCAKYITDGADVDAAAHWEAALDAAARDFVTLYQSMGVSL